MKELTKRVLEEAGMIGLQINAGKPKLIQVGKWDLVEAFQTDGQLIEVEEK